MKLVFLLRVSALLFLLLAGALLLSKSGEASIAGRYSLERALTIALVLLLTGRLLWISASPGRAERYRSRVCLLRSFPAAALYGALLLIAAFFLPDFLVSLRYHANAILMLTCAGMAALLVLPERWVNRRVVSRLALMSYAVLICLASLEIALRLLPKRGFHELRAATSRNTLTNITQEASWGAALRLSENRQRIYEFTPGSRFTFMGKRVAINEDGFRDRDRPREKPPGTYRVAALGDSVLFGWGVEAEESFLRQAELRLADCVSDRRFELLNFGVPGYNTVMEVATLRDKALAYGPDLVVVSFVWNDLDLPNFIRRPEPSRLDLSVSWFGNLIFRRNHHSMDALINAPRGSDAYRFESDPSRVPPEYRDMVGLDAYRGAMEDLAGRSRSNGLDVLVMSHDAVPAEVREVVARHGFRFVELGDRWRAYCAEQNISDPDAAWVLTADDPHPSVAGNRILGEMLADAICD